MRRMHEDVISYWHEGQVWAWRIDDDGLHCHGANERLLSVPRAHVAEAGEWLLRVLPGGEGDLGTIDGGLVVRPHQDGVRLRGWHSWIPDGHSGLVRWDPDGDGQEEGAGPWHALCDRIRHAWVIDLGYARDAGWSTAWAADGYSPRPHAHDLRSIVLGRRRA